MLNPWQPPPPQVLDLDLRQSIPQEDQSDQLPHIPLVSAYVSKCISSTKGSLCSVFGIIWPASYVKLRDQFRKEVVPLSSLLNSDSSCKNLSLSTIAY